MHCLSKQYDRHCSDWTWQFPLIKSILPPFLKSGVCFLKVGAGRRVGGDFSPVWSRHCCQARRPGRPSIKHLFSSLISNHKHWWSLISPTMQFFIKKHKFLFKNTSQSCHIVIFHEVNHTYCFSDKHPRLMARSEDVENVRLGEESSCLKCFQMKTTVSK